MSTIVVMLMLGSEAESLFREAVARQQAGHPAREAFRAAIEAYEEIRAGGASNAGLYRTLGSAYLLSGDLPRAILMFRLGLRVKPDDVALNTALDAARERVAHGPLGHPPTPRRSWLVPLFILATATWLTTCVLFTRWRMRREGSPWLAGLMLIVTLLAGLALVLGPDPEQRPLAIIAADGVPLRKGNGPLFPARYEATLNRGVEAEIIHARGEWFLIELAGGERGWVAQEDVVIE